MSRVKVFVFVLLMAAASMATVSNLTLNRTSYSPTDTILVKYQSTKDTVHNEIWVETGGDTVLGAGDRMIFDFIMVDNDTSGGNNNGKMQDMDTALHKFQLGPVGGPGFAPARYYYVVKDADDSTDKAFTATAGPAVRTISGTVTPPAGQSKQYIQVVSYPKGGGDNKANFSAFTDANGDYTIAVDSNCITVDTMFGVRINPDPNPFPGYQPNPVEASVSLKNGNATGVDFSFIALTSTIHGKVLAATGQPVKGLGVELRDSNNNNSLAQTSTNDTGFYSVGCNSGHFRLQLSSDNRSYLVPRDTPVVMGQNETKTVNFTVVKCDTVIYIRVRKDGAPLAGKFGADVHTLDNKLGNWTDINSSLTTVAVAKADTYVVCLNMGWGRDTIPAGYLLQAGDNQNVRPGDTVHFDFVKPSCSIKGRVKDSLGGAWIKGVNVRFALQNDWGNCFTATTDDSGRYVIGLAAGTWTLGLDQQNTGSLGYLQANFVPQVQITLNTGDTATRDIALIPEDTVITGRVTCNGGKPNHTFGLGAWNSIAGPNQTNYQTQDFTCDTSGYFKLKVSKLFTNYSVKLLMGGKWDTLSPGETIEGGSAQKQASIGGTVNFNILPAPVSVLGRSAAPAAFGFGTIRMTRAGLAVAFGVPKSAPVVIKIYNLSGRLVAVPAQGAYGAGWHTAFWNGSRAAGAGYVIRMTWGAGQVSRRIFLAR